MKEHDTKRATSVYAVLAIAAMLAVAILWLGFRQADRPALMPSGQITERHGAGDDILPEIIRPPICDDDRPCS